jgi:hypothetical protein
VNCCDRFLKELLDPATGAAIIERLKAHDDLPRWNDPE